MIMLGVAGTIASTGFLQIAMIVAKASGGSAEAGEFAAAMVTARLALTLPGTCEAEPLKSTCTEPRRRKSIATRIGMRQALKPSSSSQSMARKIPRGRLARAARIKRAE